MIDTDSINDLVDAEFEMDDSGNYYHIFIGAPMTAELRRDLIQKYAARLMEDAECQ